MSQNPNLCCVFLFALVLCTLGVVNCAICVQAHLESLTTSVDTLRQRVRERKGTKVEKERRKMELMQRGITIANELVSVCSEQVKMASCCTQAPQTVAAAPSEDSGSCRGNNADAQLRTACQQQRNLYMSVQQEPRSIDAFDSFADISYNDLAAVLRIAAAGDTCLPDGALQSHTSQNAASKAVDMTTSIPGSSSMNSPIDTSYVTLRGLAEEHMWRTCTRLQVTQRDTCWWVRTNFPVSRTHNLAFSSQLGSRECAASCVMSLMVSTLEFVLFTLSGEQLL